MNIMTVEDILKLDEDMPVSAIQGTIKKIGRSASGTIKRGARKGEEWHVQDITFGDETGEILIKNWAEPLPKTDVGEEYLIESHHGKRGLSGLKVAYDDYNKENCISMNESAKIKAPDGSPAPRDASDPAPEAKQESRQSASPAPRKNKATPMEIALQAAEGIRLSTKLALMLAKEFKDEYGDVTGESPTQETISSWAASINYHLRDQGQLPFLDSDIKTPDPKPKQEPPPADEDEIPF